MTCRHLEWTANAIGTSSTWWQSVHMLVAAVALCFAVMKTSGDWKLAGSGNCWSGCGGNGATLIFEWEKSGKLQRAQNPAYVEVVHCTWMTGLAAKSATSEYASYELEFCEITLSWGWATSAALLLGNWGSWFPHNAQGHFGIFKARLIDVSGEEQEKCRKCENGS